MVESANLTDGLSKCIGITMGSNSGRKRRRNIESNCNQSRRFRYLPSRPSLDRSSTFAATRTSNGWDHVRNSCPSIVDVTMDFSVVTVSRPRINSSR